MDEWGTFAVDPTEFAEERARMVQTQLLDRGIYDARVLEAMRMVPRHLFVPEPLRRFAYQDRPLEIGEGQTISQPYMVALMTQLLELSPLDRVLEIGTGSGYQAAVLSVVARHVDSIERIESLAVVARERLKTLGYDNVTVTVANGTLGNPAGAPYGAIIVTAGAPYVPTALKEQLAPQGRLVCPVGPTDVQRLVKIVREGDHFREEESIGCVFVPLIGKDGWQF